MLNIEHIIYEKKDQIGLITLNRPEKYNSMVRAMALSIQTVLDDCEKDPNIRAIYITGNGKAFCAGQDLGEATSQNGISIDKIVKEHFNPIILKLRKIEKPIVGAVNGVAAGAGANIALACDITVAKESAVFIQAFSKIGLIPDSGGTYYLPRILGIQRAAALMMLGEKVNAIEAEKIGMIYKSFPDDSFKDDSLKLARKLSKMPTKALGLTKRALNQSYSNTLDLQLALEDQLQSNAALTYDYKEGVRAFLEKRKPEFKGQ